MTEQHWDYVSEGPDHSLMRMAYERDPKAWHVKCANEHVMWFKTDNPRWAKSAIYRMRRKEPETSMTPSFDAQLVLIEWEDSAQPVPRWAWLEDAKDWNSIVRCQSVGWLIHGDEKVKVLAPNRGDVGEVRGILLPSRFRRNSFAQIATKQSDVLPAPDVLCPGIPDEK